MNINAELEIIIIKRKSKRSLLKLVISSSNRQETTLKEL